MIYELRTYTVRPEKMPVLLDLWRQVGRPLIDRHLKCLGVWTTESGELNRVVHLYVWDSYSSREELRRRFYEDSEAQAYVAQVKPLYQRQESVMLFPTDFSPRIEIVGESRHE